MINLSRQENFFPALNRGNKFRDSSPRLFTPREEFMDENILLLK